MNGNIEAVYLNTAVLNPPKVYLGGADSSTLFIRWVVIACAAFLLFVPYGTFAEFSPIAVVFVTALSLFFLAIHCFRTSKQRGENPWLAPASLLLAFYFFKYGWGALVVYFWDLFPWDANPEYATIFLRWGIKDNLPSACHLILLGGFGFYLGSSGSIPVISRWLPALKWNIDRKRFQLNLTLYAPVALFVFVFLRPILPVAIRDTVLLFGWIIWVIIVIASYNLFTVQREDRHKWVTLLAIIFLFHLVVGFQTGMRGNFLTPAVLIILGYIIARGCIPWRPLIPAIFVMLLVIIPWLTLYKQTPEQTGSIPDRIASVNDKYFGLEYRGALELGVDTLVGRFAGSPAFVSVFSQYYPDPYPFAMGQSFLDELESLIPRILWHEKPNISFLLDHYTAAVGMLPEEGDPDAGQTSAKFDAISEYYVNFGVVGVFLLAMLQGYFLKVLYFWLVKRSHLDMGASIYVVFFFINLDFFGIGQIFVAATRQLFVWPFVFWILSRKS